MDLNFAGIYSTVPYLSPTLRLPRQLGDLPGVLQRRMLDKPNGADPAGAAPDATPALAQATRTHAAAWCASGSHKASVSLLSALALGLYAPMGAMALGTLARFAVGVGGTAPKQGGTLTQQALAAVHTYGLLGLGEYAGNRLGAQGTAWRTQPQASSLTHAAGVAAHVVGYGLALGVACVMWTPRLAVAACQAGVWVGVGSLVMALGAADGALRHTFGAPAQRAYNRAVAGLYDGTQFLRQRFAAPAAQDNGHGAAPAEDVAAAEGAAPAEGTAAYDSAPAIEGEAPAEDAAPNPAIAAHASVEPEAPRRDVAA